MADTTAITSPSFHLQAGINGRTDPAYLAYRERWTGNPKRDVVDRFPIHLDLETTSACNLRCPMCFQARPETRPHYGFMARSTFERLIDEGTQKGLCSIKLQYRGEPLLSEDLEDLIAYAKQKGVIEVMFNTNATLLDPERARRLIESGVDKIICSVDGHTPEVYNPIRVFPNRPGEFETVLDNIRGLRRLREELGSETPLIRVQMVDMPENHAYVREYTAFWMQHGADAVAIEDKLDYFGEFVALSKSRAEADARKKVYPQFRCEQPWQRLFVLHSGKVTLCCGDHYHHFPLGMLLSPEQRAAHVADLQRALDNGTAREVDGFLQAPSSDRDREVKAVVGQRLADGSLGLVGVRDEYDNLVREVPDLESIWTGPELAEVRAAHREGRSHEIAICESCSLRDAAQAAFERGDHGREAAPPRAASGG